MILSPHFDAAASAYGGALIACASIVFFLLLGRIMGISGLLADAVSLTKTFGSSYVFIGAMLLTAFSAVEFGGLKPFGSARPKELSVLGVIIGGFLVGFGAKLGNGCTSGHGVCGLGRLSVRSLCAVLVFLPVAMLVASFVHSHDAIFSALHASSVSSPFHHTLPHAATAVAAVAAVVLCVGAVQIFLEPASRSAIAEVLITAVSGGIFALGLLFARMSDPHKVLDFLVLQPLLADSSASGAFPFPLSIPDRGETASGLPLMSRSHVSQVSSGWDASLMVTLGTVVCINVIALNLAPRLFATPLFANVAWPEVRKGLTWQLVIGAAIFGSGWGLAGVCPGPGLVGLASGRLFFFVWCAACLAGFHAFFTYDKIAAAWQRSAQAVAGAKKSS